MKRSPDDLLPSTRTACVVAGATPEEVQRITELGGGKKVTLTANKLGTLVTGRPGDLVIDYAAAFPGPVYDILCSAKTGWFSVTIFRGTINTTRWDNRPNTDPGYPRVDDVLGARSPLTILGGARCSGRCDRLHAILRLTSWISWIAT